MVTVFVSVVVSALAFAGAVGCERCCLPGVEFGLVVYRSIASLAEVLLPDGAMLLHVQAAGDAA